jgi:hypothetical protein
LVACLTLHSVVRRCLESFLCAGTEQVMLLLFSPLFIASQGEVGLILAETST